jgi:excisionase family DNA binding protein
MASETIAPLTYTIPEWCRSVGVSVRTSYILQGRMEAPRTVRVGRKVLIRRAAAEEWLRARESRGCLWREAAAHHDVLESLLVDIQNKANDPEAVRKLAMEAFGCSVELRGLP